MALWTLGVRQWHSTSYMKMHDSSIVGFVLLVVRGACIAYRQTKRTCGLRILLAGTEPGSGGSDPQTPR